MTALEATDAVLSSPELLEHILVTLPMRFLLTIAPCVCRHWRDVIFASPALQQRLFFKPVPKRGDTPSALPDRIATNFPQNPLLAELFPPFFADMGKFPGTSRTSSHTKPADRVSAWEKLALNKNPDAFLRAGASWRRMFTQQPPALVLPFFNCVIDRQDMLFVFAHQRRRHRPEGGLRMGALYDVVWEHTQYQKQQACVLWAGDTTLSEEEQAALDGNQPSEFGFIIGQRGEHKQSVRRTIYEMLLRSGIVVVRYEMRDPRRPLVARPGSEGYKSADFESVQLVKDGEEPDETSARWMIGGLQSAMA
jgi:hypothetical protein